MKPSGGSRWRSCSASRCACRSGSRRCARPWTATPRSSASWPGIPARGRRCGASPTALRSTPGWRRRSWRRWARPPRRCACPYFLLGLALIPIAYGLGAGPPPGGGVPGGGAPGLPAALLPSPRRAAPAVLRDDPRPLRRAAPARAPAGRRLARGRDAAPGRLVPWGVLAGLALWTHLMSASAVAAASALSLRSARGRRGTLAFALLPAAPRQRPLVDARARRPRGHAHRAGRRAARRRPSATCARSLPRLHEPMGGVLGTHVPVVADSSDFVLYAPAAVRVGLVLLYGVLLILAVRASSAAAAAALLLAAAALALARLPLPVRAAPHTLRFLTPAWSCRCSCSRPGRRWRGRPRRSWLAVLALGGLHLAGGAQLLEAWRSADRAEPPFVLPDLAPVRRLLEVARDAARLRLVRPRLPPHLGERREDRGLAALERALPALPAAPARRGAVRARTWPGS